MEWTESGAQAMSKLEPGREKGVDRALSVLHIVCFLFNVNMDNCK